jgi:hypothetical protein
MLLDDALGIPIVTKPCEFRVPKMIALRPFQEFDLSHKLRLNPDTFLHVPSESLKSTVIPESDIR